MHLNKSTGLGGLTVKLYRHFWPLIGNLVIDSLYESSIRGTFYTHKIDKKQAIFSLLYKKDDPKNLKNLASSINT